ncbi:MAG: hypothetical protein M3Q07_23565 [Pseudobdellovibrionaceae bacterium]|nr:hypothetical protein [Pseudobdellovibrionaceae bacterium]
MSAVIWKLLSRPSLQYVAAAKKLAVPSLIWMANKNGNADSLQRAATKFPKKMDLLPLGLCVKPKATSFFFEEKRL